MTELRAFLQNALAIKSARVAELSTQYQTLNQYLSEVTLELSLASKELKELESAAEAIGFQATSAPSVKPELPNEPPITIKQAIREVLIEHGPQSSGDLLSAINRRYFNNKLERTSFSPQLSRLRKVGEVDLAGTDWIITERGAEKYIFLSGSPEGGPDSETAEENEPSDVGTSNGSEAASVFD